MFISYSKNSADMANRTKKRTLKTKIMISFINKNTQTTRLGQICPIWHSTESLYHGTCMTIIHSGNPRKREPRANPRAGFVGHQTMEVNPPIRWRGLNATVFGWLRVKTELTTLTHGTRTYLIHGILPDSPEDVTWLLGPALGVGYGRFV